MWLLTSGWLPDPWSPHMSGREGSRSVRDQGTGLSVQGCACKWHTGSLSCGPNCSGTQKQLWQQAHNLGGPRGPNPEPTPVPAPRPHVVCLSHGAGTTGPSACLLSVQHRTAVSSSEGVFSSRVTCYHLAVRATSLVMSPPERGLLEQPGLSPSVPVSSIKWVQMSS